MADSFAEIRHVRSLLTQHVNSKHQFDESENVISILRFLKRMEEKLDKLDVAIANIQLQERQVIVESRPSEIILETKSSKSKLDIDFKDAEFIPDIEVSDKSIARVKDVESKKTQVKTNLSIFEQILGDKK